MKRYDLRHLQNNFLGRLNEIMSSMSEGEVAIFMFEVKDFDNVQRAIDCVLDAKNELMNSLRFNEVDWSIVVKKAAK